MAVMVQSFLAQTHTFRYADMQLHLSEVLHRHVGWNAERLTHFGFFNRRHPGTTDGQVV